MPKKKTTAKKTVAKKATRKKTAVKKSPAKSTKKTKYVYFFGKGRADGNGKMRELLGGKGANLAEMVRIKLPVPAGFTISTDVCTYYYDHKRTYPKTLQAEINANIVKLEKAMGKKFGDVKNPLLVAVRSGARDSMPGMMDTILNLGLNDKTVEGLVVKTGNERFAYDCYRRFIQMYGDVVMGVQTRPGEDHEPFETVITELKNELFPGRRHVEDTELDAAALKELVKRFKKLVKDRTKKTFPEDPKAQLMGAVGAVFGSWNNDRAIVYRRKYGIPHEWGTAVNVQAMVFGNMGEDSGSGVAFTRDPATGEKVLYGEFLVNAQGEDVVAGVRTPQPVIEMQQAFPPVYKELLGVCKTLEGHFKDMQDFEFTVEEGTLYMLQTRNGKRTGVAAVKIAVDMVKERLIKAEQAVTRVDPDSLSQLLAPIFDIAAQKSAKQIAKGLPAGPGAATGRIYFNADEAESAAARGEKVLLVREETSPEDLRGMIAAEGILTARGGVSSHAALVARQMGKVCVCGASELHIDYEKQKLSVDGQNYGKGDYLSIDGTSGAVFAGEVPTAASEVIQVLIEKKLNPAKSKTYQIFNQLMKWADKYRKMGIRTNADSPDQVNNAVAFGAEGIGLCRTEHMFFEGDRIDAVREMILAESETARRAALGKLLPYQKKDFAGIFKALKGKPATIRLLDPPLHEFLPHDHSAQNDLANKLEVPVDTITQRIHALAEFNPMLGHRGCRLGNVYPEITEMQARAICEAAAEVQKSGTKVAPEIMVPLVGFPKELQLQVAVIHRVAKEVMAQKKVKFKYQVGTMIEIPRACMVADEIAETAEFFSFGTNDLTQTTMGMSRDDSGSFLPFYQEEEIVANNPFAVVDQKGVGSLMEIAIEKAQTTRPKIKLGICGEHGGEPNSVKFCHQIGLNYVSCSPFRVPVARLAAAQAALQK
ncbi:MAG: pyruvate, phosphate dikinase [Verrucomicrobiota bacterium]